MFILLEEAKNTIEYCQLIKINSRGKSKYPVVGDRGKCWMSFVFDLNFYFYRPTPIPPPSKGVI